MKVTYDVLLNLINQKKYQPLILLQGDEPYYVDKLTHLIQDTFFEDEAMRDFNFNLFYGLDTTPQAVAAAARQYPMMAPLRLVIVREAQHLKKIEDLSAYAKSPQPQTVLVLSFMEGEKLNGKTSLSRQIQENGLFFDSPKIYENKMAEHVKRMADEKNLIIHEREAQLLIANVGDLTRISNELNKISALTPKGQCQELTKELIEKHIGISREFNIYELQTAVLSRNYDKAYAICEYYVNNPHKCLPGYFNILHAAFFQLMKCYYSADKSEMYLKSIGVHWKEYGFYSNSRYSINGIRNILHLINQYSVDDKGGRGYTTDRPQLLKELVVKILHS